VISDAAEPIKSKEYHYRVKTALGEKPIDVLWLTNVSLKEGSYQILFKGDAQDSTGATAGLVLGFVGYKVEEAVLPVDNHPSFTLSHIFKVEKGGRIDIRFKISGKGTLVLDTVRIVPVKKGLLAG
jgi:hypothetical protein